jgi:hypothetical protein
MQFIVIENYKKVIYLFLTFDFTTLIFRLITYSIQAFQRNNHRNLSLCPPFFRRQ